jgi:hypothetical protein
VWESEEVKNSLLDLFLPLLPPPPWIVNVIQPRPLLPSSPAGAEWWLQPSLVPAAVDVWRLIPSCLLLDFDIYQYTIVDTAATQQRRGH